MIWCEAPLCTPSKWASYRRFAKGEARDRIGSGIYFMPLQSVYMRELKLALVERKGIIQLILQSVYIGELK